MATTIRTSSAASPGGVRLWRQQQLGQNLHALLALLAPTALTLSVGYSRASQIDLGVRVG